ncbi:uncharacterized protein AMSG_01321 [Thecamonas trahens ATCC 50062]|uniref:Uncharacterized protein n=1 Tax=Thecamonas trahens ATCC 50062 TaxID=461836 RepID=A0A0L0DNN9_THETB|nr:hypothetical protein AMSG_01321 [Thecamonas trahens ATCC 50062]KNC53611.1 hypothetical protein AMSG_01321 [Thecamonas trahens ATCC 50062]|eukprot:XP_013761928.1 hypothetical protein AMSG_01321 [Thecamonas trahens ATCC 50062]
MRLYERNVAYIRVGKTKMLPLILHVRPADLEWLGMAMVRDELLPLLRPLVAETLAVAEALRPGQLDDALPPRVLVGSLLQATVRWAPAAAETARCELLRLRMGPAARPVASGKRPRAPVGSELPGEEDEDGRARKARKVDEDAPPAAQARAPPGSAPASSSGAAGPSREPLTTSARALVVRVYPVAQDAENPIVMLDMPEKS